MAPIAADTATATYGLVGDKLLNMDVITKTCQDGNNNVRTGNPSRFGLKTASGSNLTLDALF